MQEHINKFKEAVLSDRNSCSMTFQKGKDVIEFRFRQIPESKRFQLREMVSGNRIAMTYAWSRQEIVRNFESDIIKYL